MAQSTSSLGSHSSQRSSPSQSFQRQPHHTDVPIDTLIAYLVAAKRSLSSIHLVHQATTILSEARSTIEGAAAITARTKYLRRALAIQLRLLRGIQYEIEASSQAVKSDIQVVLAELEDADRQLSDTIDKLKVTKIESGFKDATRAKIEADAGIAPKDTLHDFIDDKPVEEVKGSIQAAIDDVEAAETRIDESIRALEEELQTINAAISNEPASGSLAESNLKPLKISPTLKMLEAHAHEMATSLESLVKHFDLCVTAIKHTEGAGALVAKAVATDDLPEGVDVNDLTGPQLTDLSPEERAEMLQVLANDAAEVDEVVLELQDRAAEMEAMLDALARWRDQHSREYGEVQAAFRLLEQLSAKLPSLAAETNTFSGRWNEARLRILDGQSALSDLSGVYEQFLDSYDGLVVEAARRRSVRKQMLRIVHEAHARLEQLYDEDLNERDLFRSERGDFLPSDIWSGLGALPPRWVMQRVDQNEGEDDSIPDLPRKTVEEALGRLKRKVERDMVGSGPSK